MVAIAFIGLLVTLLFFIGGYAASNRAQYYGFISCAKSPKLLFMHEFLTLEWMALILFLLLGTIHAFFLCHKKTNNLISYCTAAMVVNLTAITYKVVEYPIVLRRNSIFSAVEAGTMRNPLFIIGLLHALLIIAWSNSALKSRLSLKQRRKSSLIILLLILAGFALYLSTVPARCFG